VKKDGVFGYIDKNNVVVVPIEADKTEELEGAIIRMEKKDKLAYFDLKAKKFVWKEEGY